MSDTTVNGRKDVRRSRVAAWAARGALAVAAIEIGGSLYEHLVVDTAWLRNFAIIQPEQGGIDRKVFWMPLHAAMTLLLPVAIWGSWKSRPARQWLLGALGIHVVTRAWTLAWFVPRALRFEQAPAMTDALQLEAMTWVWTSVLRLPLTLGMLASIRVAMRHLEEAGRRRAAPSDGAVDRAAGLEQRRVQPAAPQPAAS